MTVGDRLRAWREAMGFSQILAADMAGVRQATWSEWENDRKKPQIEKAVTLARITNGKVPVDAWAETKSEQKARVARALARKAG